MKRLLLAGLLTVCPACATAPATVEPIATAGIDCLAAARERVDVEACVRRVAVEAHRAVCVDTSPLIAAGLKAALGALTGRPVSTSARLPRR